MSFFDTSILNYSSTECHIINAILLIVSQVADVYVLDIVWWEKSLCFCLNLVLKHMQYFISYFGRIIRSFDHITAKLICLGWLFYWHLSKMAAEKYIFDNGNVKYIVLESVCVLGLIMNKTFYHS